MSHFAFYGFTLEPFLTFRHGPEGLMTNETFEFLCQTGAQMGRLASKSHALTASSLERFILPQQHTEQSKPVLLGPNKD